MVELISSPANKKNALRKLENRSRGGELLHGHFQFTWASLFCLTYNWWAVHANRAAWPDIITHRKPTDKPGQSYHIYKESKRFFLVPYSWKTISKTRSIIAALPTEYYKHHHGTYTGSPFITGIGIVSIWKMGSPHDFLQQTVLFPFSMVY